MRRHVSKSTIGSERRCSAKLSSSCGDSDLGVGIVCGWGWFWQVILRSKFSHTGFTSNDGRLSVSIYHVKYNSDHEAAAGADGNVLLVAKVVQGDLELIAAWARVEVGLLGFVEGHVLDLDLIVDRDVLVVRHLCGNLGMLFV